MLPTHHPRSPATSSDMSQPPARGDELGGTYHATVQRSPAGSQSDYQQHTCTTSAEPTEIGTHVAQLQPV